MGIAECNNGAHERFLQPAIIQTLKQELVGISSHQPQAKPLISNNIQKTLLRFMHDFQMQKLTYLLTRRTCKADHIIMQLDLRFHIKR